MENVYHDRDLSEVEFRVPSKAWPVVRSLVERGRGGLLTHAEYYRAVASLRQLESFSPYIVREYYTSRVSWAVYTVEWLDSMARLLRNSKVLEVCAGRGVLIDLMRKRGVDWTATESHTPAGCSPELIQQEALDAVRSFDPHHHMAPDVVFVSWIPYESTLDQELMLLCKEREIPLIIVGESPGGCTGSHTFAQDQLSEYEAERGDKPCLAMPFWRTAMNSVFEQYSLGSFCDVPVWEGMHDHTCVCFAGDSVIESVLERADIWSKTNQ